MALRRTRLTAMHGLVIATKAVNGWSISDELFFFYCSKSKQVVIGALVRVEIDIMCNLRALQAHYRNTIDKGPHTLSSVSLLKTIVVF